VGLATLTHAFVHAILPLIHTRVHTYIFIWLGQT